MISFAITTSNEGQYVRNLLEQLVPYCNQSGDEIIVLDDNSTDKTTIDAFDWARKANKDFQIVFRHFRSILYPTSFADHKNYLNKFCSGDYIFQIDADELLHENLLLSLPELLDYNKDVELFHIPRVNIVNGLTQEDISKWGWKVNEKGWVMFPDYQGRLYKNHPDIKWEGKVHEHIIGAETISVLPPEEEWSIIHVKEIDRQRKQNEFYNTIGR